MVEGEAQIGHGPDGDGVVGIGEQRMAAVTTTGRFRIAPTPRMPACGWTRIGMANRLPPVP